VGDRGSILARLRQHGWPAYERIEGKLGERTDGVRLDLELLRIAASST
jgi:hypothetical protein